MTKQEWLDEFKEVFKINSSLVYIFEHFPHLKQINDDRTLAYLVHSRLNEMEEVDLFLPGNNNIKGKIIGKILDTESRANPDKTIKLIEAELEIRRNLEGQDGNLSRSG